MIPSIRQQLRKPPISRKARPWGRALIALWALCLLASLNQPNGCGRPPATPVPEQRPAAKSNPEQGRGPRHTFHVTGNGRVLRKFATLEEAAAHRRAIACAYRITTLTCSCGTHED